MDHLIETVNQVHARLRISNGFQIGQLVAEYLALRASILLLWTAQGQDCEPQELLRFNEAIDAAIIDASNWYVKLMVRNRDLFLGILSHDLRNPLHGILASATLMAMSKDLDDNTSRSAIRIVNSAKRMSRMLDSLIALTRLRFGSGIPIKAAPMDLDPVCRQVISELKAIHPDRALQFESKGDLRGTWDSDCLAQVLSNLIANALQHGAKNQPITVGARAQGEEVILEVHNEGPTIPDSVMATMFEPGVRHPIQEDSVSAHLGLGLFIAKEIAVAHGAKLTVTSADKEGTTFQLRLPRHAQASTVG